MPTTETLKTRLTTRQSGNDRTKDKYAANLMENLDDLIGRLHRMEMCILSPELPQKYLDEHGWPEITHRV